ncbi:transmembrane and ubiquitin-like domain-containing protein 1 [Bombina bombina]|uniref:transmembrane and ubiquitin-like domain-containing protein 1 n=1 Tax=Bombina bombina TaxID=8345 RepID=UPI00235AD07D|nr:transmembrane and ubiquitin-like domain-containing protein 1 [Bombina bombina]
MALIEGIGDEVTVLFGLLVLLLVLVLAWVSTHTSERTHLPWASPSGESAGSSQEDDQRGDPSDAINSVNTEPSPSATAEPGEDGSTIQLRLKFLNDTERLVTVQPLHTIAHIKRTHFPGQEQRVRLIYQGQLLRDDSQTVSSLQLRDGSVLHCHISQYTAGPGMGGQEVAQVPLNIGNLLVPVLGLVLGMMWYCQLQYPHFFTSTATTCLGGLTLLASAFAFSSYRR